ncbi:MAG TPA: hypothetical protein VGC65_11070 [Bacteroidia bacterium]|jgi:quinol monooxygenase YgiN
MATTIISTQKVENFIKWKQGFDAGAAMRAQAGIVIKNVYQSVDDENSVTVISECPNADIAKAVLSGPGMKEAMEKSGVISTPEVKILNQII